MKFYMQLKTLLVENTFRTKKHQRKPPSVRFITNQCITQRLSAIISLDLLQKYKALKADSRYSITLIEIINNRTAECKYLRMNVYEA